MASSAVPKNPDLCILGAGSAGLALAAGAVQLGASVVLIEPNKMGGDCLNYGCIPSKALLIAARAAHHARGASRFGVSCDTVRVDFKAVHDHVHGVVAAIEPNDSQERFEKLGCTVLRAPARFVDPKTVEVDGAKIQARNFVVATGSGPLVPPIPGLRETPHLTNETVFELTECPKSLIVLGGGPIGCELGQAFARLGAKVHIVELAQVLPRDDQDAAAIVRASLQQDGITLHEGQKATRVEATDGGGVRVFTEGADGTESGVEADLLLCALGRTPNLKNLNLEAAGIEYGRAGIKNNERLRTSNKRVWVAGDVAGRLQFTHVAGYHAGILVRNILFRTPAKVREDAVPWVTYTEPELAQVGHTLQTATKAGLKVKPAEWKFAENDRAQAERDTSGFVRAVIDARGRVVGCTVVGPHAGELIMPWVLAVTEKMKLVKMTGAIAPYPTLAEAGKRAAGAYFTPQLFSDRTRKLVRLLKKLPG